MVNVITDKIGTWIMQQRKAERLSGEKCKQQQSLAAGSQSRLL